MPLIVLEDALGPIQETQKEQDFAELIRNARDALGIKQYRAAEFIGISTGRLKNLETGYFRDMPAHAELIAIARLYDLNMNLLEKKAHTHCEERSVRKKIRTCYDDGEMQCVQA